MYGECSLFAKHYYTGEANAVEPFLANGRGFDSRPLKRKLKRPIYRRTWI